MSYVAFDIAYTHVATATVSFSGVSLALHKTFVDSLKLYKIVKQQPQFRKYMTINEKISSSDNQLINLYRFTELEIAPRKRWNCRVLLLKNCIALKSIRSVKRIYFNLIYGLI